MGEAKRRAKQEACERFSHPMKPARFDLYALGARMSLTRVMSRELTHWSDADE